MPQHKSPGETPEQMPSSIPQLGGSADNWILQSLNQLNVTVAVISNDIKHMSQTLDEVKEVSAKTRDSVKVLEKKVYAAAAVVSVVIAIGCYFGNKALDFGLAMAKANAEKVAVYPAQPAPIPPKAKQ